MYWFAKASNTELHRFAKQSLQTHAILYGLGENYGFQLVLATFS